MNKKELYERIKEFNQEEIYFDRLEDEDDLPLEEGPYKEEYKNYKERKREFINRVVEEFIHPESELNGDIVNDYTYFYMRAEYSEGWITIAAEDYYDGEEEKLFFSKYDVEKEESFSKLLYMINEKMLSSPELVFFNRELHNAIEDIKQQSESQSFSKTIDSFNLDEGESKEVFLRNVDSFYLAALDKINMVDRFRDASDYIGVILSKFREDLQYATQVDLLTYDSENKPEKKEFYQRYLETATGRLTQLEDELKKRYPEIDLQYDFDDFVKKHIKDIRSRSEGPYPVYSSLSNVVNRNGEEFCLGNIEIKCENTGNFYIGSYGDNKIAALSKLYFDDESYEFHDLIKHTEGGLTAVFYRGEEIGYDDNAGQYRLDNVQCIGIYNKDGEDVWPQLLDAYLVEKGPNSLDYKTLDLAEIAAKYDEISRAGRPMVLSTLNLLELAEKIGNQPQEVTLHNGTTRMSVNWDGPMAQKALAEAYPLSMKGDKVVIDGPAPAWFASALTHVVHPCPVALHDPKVGDIDIPNLSRGEANPAGEIAFNVKVGEHGVLLTWSIDNGTMPPVYDHNNLSKIVVPDIPEGKPLFIDGRGPNFITVALGEAYAHTQPSVSYHQPQNKAYVCGITHDRTIQVGVMTPDDRVNELVKSRDEMTKEEVLNRAIFGESFAPKYSPDEKARFDTEYRGYLEKMVDFNSEERALLNEYDIHDPEMDAFYERKNDFAAEFIKFTNKYDKMPVTADMIYLTEYGNNTTYYDKLKINLNEVGAQEEFTILPIVVAERDVDLLKFYMDRGIKYCDSYDIRFEPSPDNGSDLEEVSVNEGKAMGDFVFPPNCLVHNFEHAYETPEIDRQQHARELIGYFLGDNDVCNSDRLFFSPDYGDRWIEQFKNSDSFREVLQSAASDLSRVDLQTLRDHEVEKNGVMSRFPWQYISEDIYKDMIRDGRSEVEECRMEYIRGTARFENNPDLEDELKENLDRALYKAPEEILNDKALMIGCVEIDGSLIQRVSEELQKDKDVIKAAIRENAENIAYIKDQTPEICMEAVKQNVFALEYVNDQTPELCMEAVRQNGWALRSVKEPTPEICMAAVQQNGLALEYVNDQTPELCMEAVRQNVWALPYVKKQTPEICLTAVENEYRAFMYVKDPTPEIAAVACRKGAEEGLSIEEVLGLNDNIKLSDKDLEIIRSGEPEQTVDESPEEKTEKGSDDRFDIGSKLESMTKKAEDNKGEGQGESQGESQGETPTDR